MYVEKDRNGKMIFQDLSEDDVKLFLECFCTYLIMHDQKGEPDKMNRVKCLIDEVNKYL